MKKFAVPEPRPEVIVTVAAEPLADAVWLQPSAYVWPVAPATYPPAEVHVTEPTAAWGLMLSGNASDFYREAPWMILAPGLAISAAVFSFNLFGESMVCTPRDAVRSFYSSGVDAMVAGNFLLEK